MVSWLVRLAGAADANTERREQAGTAKWRGVEVEEIPERQAKSGETRVFSLGLGASGLGFPVFDFCWLAPCSLRVETVGEPGGDYATAIGESWAVKC